MRGETQFQVKTGVDQLQKEMRQAEKALLEQDNDLPITAIESIYGTNQRVMEWSAELRKQKSEQNYKEWLKDMNPLGGCA